MRLFGECWSRFSTAEVRLSGCPVSAQKPGYLEARFRHRSHFFYSLVPAERFWLIEACSVELFFHVFRYRSTEGKKLRPWIFKNLGFCKTNSAWSCFLIDESVLKFVFWGTRMCPGISSVPNSWTPRLQPEQNKLSCSASGDDILLKITCCTEYLSWFCKGICSSDKIKRLQPHGCSLIVILYAVF